MSYSCLKKSINSAHSFGFSNLKPDLPCLPSFTVFSLLTLKFLDNFNFRLYLHADFFLFMGINQVLPSWHREQTPLNEGVNVLASGFLFPWRIHKSHPEAQQLPLIALYAGLFQGTQFPSKLIMGPFFFSSISKFFPIQLVPKLWKMEIEI